MDVLDTLLSLLGWRRSASDPPRETTVTVEYEPRVETEAAVKGSGIAAERRESGDDGSTGAADGDGDEVGTDRADGEIADPDDTPETAAESVRVIEGIGPAYADRLSAAGVDTVADLAAADAGALSSATDLSAKRLGRWVERARDRRG